MPTKSIGAAFALIFILAVGQDATSDTHFGVAAFCPRHESSRTSKVHHSHAIRDSAINNNLELNSDPAISTTPNDTRRSFLQRAPLLVTSLVVASAIESALPTPAVASGGATAGGAYLLSAKQRYNDRVKKGVKGFVALGSSLASEDIPAVKNFFTEEEIGSWKDFSAAGFLLSNAFRRNSSAAPDSLPSVKKWKAFSSQVKTLITALSKKGKDGKLAAYDAALATLDEYLDLVELPSSKEIATSS